MTERIGEPDRRDLGVHILAEGTSGRTVLLCPASSEPSGGDPDAGATAARNITLIAVDGPAYIGDLAANADALVVAVTRVATPPVGIVGWSDGGWLALAVAARHPELVDRLALVGTPRPDEDDAPAAWGFALADVVAKTLVLAGSADPTGGPRHGTWYQRALPTARYEQVPGGDQHLLAPMWARVLSHLAPRNHR